MEAVVVSASATRSGGGADDGESQWHDDIASFFGGTKWHLVLDVMSSDGQQFRHSATHKVSNRLGGLRRQLVNWRPLPGLAVPVLVSADHRDLEIDWESFVARGGIEQAATLTDRRGAEQGANEMGKMLQKRPKLAEQQRAMILKHGPGMADQVVSGVRPADEFRRQISSLVQGGALSAEEADDLLRRAGLV